MRELRIHKSITQDKLIAACEDAMTGLENPGFCISCGFEQDGCEPDARQYRCEACGEHSVYGAEELLLMVA